MSKFKPIQKEINMRADVFLTKKYKDFSRSLLRKLFTDEKVLINNKIAVPAYKIRPGDLISVNDKALFINPGRINLPIIFEDYDVIVINKPSGILTHSKGILNDEPTVASFIEDKLNDASLKGNRAGIVHRLDRLTSGIIICAKNQKSLGHLQKQFSQRKVKKTYLAIVDGVPDPPEALIDAPIGRNPKKPQTFMAISSGKPAKTQYKIMKASSKKALLELSPETGRTNQLRVHMAYIGHPIVGDKVYGGEDRSMLLHAESLELTLPDGKRRKFKVDPPITFREFINGE